MAPKTKKAPAKKPVAKPVVKPAAKPAVKPVAKKAPVKKAVVKPAAVVAPEVKSAPVAEKACSSSCGCGCKCGKFGRFVKKLIVFLVIFALGFAAAKFCCYYGKTHHFNRGFDHSKIFTENCVDFSKIECPKMIEKIAMADADGDGCVTKQELRAAKSAFKKFGHKKCGDDCGCDKTDD